ncbi:MerR family transcriptional regulator [Clostridiaceae bacterium M8S5]|nr:MerR family transcriptional regulator [Clostridiaceae bacterium M8S5]
MYRIGLFSKMNRITTKTLRYYEKIGLLKPAYIDDETGYRYYTSNQLPKLHKIITLKQMGLSLTDIMHIVDQPISVEVFLKLKEKELNEVINDNKKKILQIKNYMKILSNDEHIKYNPVVRSLPRVNVASMRFIASSYDEYFEIIPKMGLEMRRKGAVCAEPEYCFNIYHDGEYKEKNIDVETCEAVVELCEDSDLVKYKVIEKVDEALCLLHRGPYETLREAHWFAYKWIDDNGYNVIGNPRESYIDGIWNKDDKDLWLTEIQIPIKK